MTEEEQIDIIIDILTDFDEMGFAPTTTVPDPETYAIKWRNKLTDALKDYRNRQKAEIERLQYYNENLRCINTDLSNNLLDEVKTARAEAVKEFAEELKKDISWHRTEMYMNGLKGTPRTHEITYETVEEYIDNLVKEFMEEKGNG